MTKQIRLFVFVSFIAMLFLSCDNPKKEVSQKSNDNIERINTFIKNNKAIENWSSFFKQKHPFTYHYDEFISHYKDSLLYFRGYVDDIVKNDSTYICIVYHYDDYFTYLELSCTKQQVKMIENNKTETDYKPFGILIKANSYSKPKFNVYADEIYVEPNEGDYYQSELEIDISDTYILHGEMIDLVSLNVKYIWELPNE